jgi:peptidyl-prolyl cis-trans isomerase D
MAAGVKRLSKTFVWILMGMLIVGLAGFGAVNFSGSVTSVAQVGTQTVSIDAYFRELQSEQRAIQAQTGQTIQMSQMRDLGLDRAVLGRLVALASIDNEVDELGLSIGDENLQKEVVEISAFHDINGEFDRETYRFSLEQAGLSEADFEADLRAEAARTLVQGAIMAGVQMPLTLTETLTGYIAARRSFTWAQLTASDLNTPIAPPTDAQLQAYYDTNTDQFMLPETKQITYVSMTPAMLVDGIELEDATLRDLFEERAEEYQTPERRLVERLVFADEAGAADAKAQLEVNGTTFDLLVQDRGLQLSDIDLGDVTRADLGAAADAVFATQVGTVVGPLPSDLGPALFRINGLLDARVTTFEEAEAELRDELAADRARRLIEAQAENIDDMLAGGATLEELAGETDMELAKIDWTAEASEDIAAYAEFRSVAEAIAEGDFPEVEFLEDGGLFAARLDAILPARPEPFEQARADVNAAWLRDQTETALRAQADALITDLAASGDFAATGLAINTETGLTRTAFLENTPPDMMAQVFEMEPDDLRVVSGENSVLILRLDAILPPEESEDLTRLNQALSNEMNQALSQALFTAFAQDAQNRARPQIDQNALNAVAASFQ